MNPSLLTFVMIDEHLRSLFFLKTSSTLRTSGPPVADQGADTGSTSSDDLLVLDASNHIQCLLVHYLAAGRLLQDGGAAVPALGSGQLSALARKILLQTLLTLLGSTVVAGAQALIFLCLKGKLGAGLGAGSAIWRSTTRMKKTPLTPKHTASMAVRSSTVARGKTLAPLVWLRQTVASSTGSQHRKRGNSFLLAGGQQRTVAFSSIQVLLVAPVVAEIVLVAMI